MVVRSENRELDLCYRNHGPEIWGLWEFRKIGVEMVGELCRWRLDQPTQICVCWIYEGMGELEEKTAFYVDTRWDIAIYVDFLVYKFPKCSEKDGDPYQYV